MGKKIIFCKKVSYRIFYLILVKTQLFCSFLIILNEDGILVQKTAKTQEMLNKYLKTKNNNNNINNITLF